MSHCTPTATTAALSFLFLTSTTTEATLPRTNCGPLVDILTRFAANHREVPVAAGNMTDRSVAILLTTEPTGDQENRQPETWTLLTAKITTRGPLAGQPVGCFGLSGEDWFSIPPEDIGNTDAAIVKASSLVPHGTIVEHLRRNAREVLQGFAVDSNGYLIELFASNTTIERTPGEHFSSPLKRAPVADTFTILVTDPYKYSSIFAAGRDWRQVRLSPQTAPAP